MKITSPELNIEDDATDDLIESVVSALINKANTFAILSKTEMNYVQALATDQGFVVQFQRESIDQHYEFEEYLSPPQTISLFQAYLANTPDWQGSFKYVKVNLRGFWGSIGLVLGRFIGGFVRGFKESPKKT